MSKRVAVVGVGVLLLVVLAAGLTWFEPWRLFTDSTVDEAVPTSSPQPVGDSDPQTTAPAPASTTPTPEPQDTVLARGHGGYHAARRAPPA